jgi:hypothetical protein
MENISNMNDGLMFSLIAGGFALAGSIITGWFTYKSSVSAKETERNKRRLIQTYLDIAAFHRLEEKYTKTLETPIKSANAWKLELRKLLRDDGFQSPSEDATAQKAESRLRDLV